MFVKDQQTKILDQGAKQDRPQGEGSNKKGQKEPNKTKQQERTRKSHPSTEERNRTRKTTRHTDRSTKQNNDPKNPTGQRIKGTTEPPQGTEGGTDSNFAESSALDFSEGCIAILDGTTSCWR